jgi:hypothetical protein
MLAMLPARAVVGVVVVAGVARSVKRAVVTAVIDNNSSSGVDHSVSRRNRPRLQRRPRLARSA